MNHPTTKDHWLAFPALRSWFDDVFGHEAPARLANRLPEVFSREFVPPLNVAESENSIVVTLEAPGMEESDFDIDVMGNQLTVTGEKKFETESKDKEYRRVESQFGSFSRTITLPHHLRTDSVDAVYKTGVLTITIPKVEPTPSSKVKVRSE